MRDLIVAPVALPFLAGALQLALIRADLSVRRTVAGVVMVLLSAVVVALFVMAGSGEIRVYAVGDWMVPLGIVLVLDRLSAYLLLLTAIVGAASLACSLRGWDERGANFHALFMFQLAGINGAFLTGDLFNLFVFFEVILIASSCLMLHGGGEARLRAGITYVVMNVVGSVLFLIAVGLVYGVAGTLTIADLARVVADLGAADAAIMRIGAVLLLLVFALKAAIVPLHFWLPDGYAATAAPVAALFAVLTKVGAYAILRIFTVVFGAEAGPLANFAQGWLLPAALITLWVGMLGATASRSLRELVCFLLVASMGTLFVAFSLFSVAAIAAGLYYLAHTTLVTAGLFLLVERVAAERGALRTSMRPGPALARPLVVGWGFLIGATALVGLPPLSGFIGKMMLLQSAVDSGAADWIFVTVLGSALFGLIGASRAGAIVFWHQDPGATAQIGEGTAPPQAGGARGTLPPGLVLIGASIVLTLAAGPVVDYTTATAAQISTPSAYIDAVLQYRHPLRESAP